MKQIEEIAKNEMKNWANPGCVIKLSEFPSEMTDNLFAAIKQNTSMQILQLHCMELDDAAIERTPTRPHARMRPHALSRTDTHTRTHTSTRAHTHAHKGADTRANSRRLTRTHAM